MGLEPPALMPAPAPEPAPQPGPQTGPESSPAASGPALSGPEASGPTFELPTARQVVGRGLQLAFDASRDIRRVSIYVGLLLLALVGPFVILVVADASRIGDLAASFDLQTGTFDEQTAEALGLVILQLYVAGALASIGALAIVIDGSLMAVAVLGGRIVDRPLQVLEALQRSRQVFWRYAGAATLVGILSAIVTLVVGLIDGSDGPSASLGSSLLASLAGTALTAPFGYILTATVIGDVSAMTAVRRSLTLARARPALAVVVAAFAFFAQAIQLFGVSAALDVAGSFVEVVHPNLEAGAETAIVALVLAAIAVVAYGSLTVTVGAISAAPQVAAFIGLTHFAAGLDRARLPSPDGPPAATQPGAQGLVPGLELPLGGQVLAGGSVPMGPGPSSEAPGVPMPGTESAPPVVSAPTTVVLPRRTTTRWVTRPMLVLIALEVLIVVLALAGSGQPAG